MKRYKRFFTLLWVVILTLSSCSDLFASKNLRLYYISNDGSKVYLAKLEEYDINEKPTVFYFDNTEFEDTTLLIVDVYRFVLDSSGRQEEHFYKTVRINSKNKMKGLALEDMFEDLNSPFVNSTGFKISACKTSKANWFNLRQYKACDSYSEFILTYGP